MRHPLLRLAIFLALCSASSRAWADSEMQIWSIPVPQIAEKMKAGDLSILESVELGTIDISQVQKLGAGGGLYLSFAFERLRKFDEAELMLEAEIAGRIASGDPGEKVFLNEAIYRLISLQSGKNNKKSAGTALSRTETIVSSKPMTGRFPIFCRRVFQGQEWI